MSASSQARPPRALTPHLIVRGAASAIEFYTRAFGAHERYRLVEPGGKVGHAEIEIGGSLVMLADEYPDFGALSPGSIGGSPVKLHLSVPDADAAVCQAVAAGATEIRPVKDEFYGERVGMVADPFGYTWTLAAPIEEVSPEEMQRRFTAVLTAGTT